MKTVSVNVYLGAFLIALAPSISTLAADLPVATPESMRIDADALKPIDGLVQQGIEDSRMPGAVVLIGHAGSVVFHRAYGDSQTTPSRLPMKTDTVFDLASLTKPIATATSIMVLLDRGIIDLQDEVSDHLPEFGENGKQEVTIQQLLLHIGGLIPDNSLSDYRDGREKSVENLMKIDLNYEPGSRFRYSDVGFMVLAELVSRKTGQDIHAFSQEAIFEPLGMTETSYLPDEKLRVRAATTEQREGRWMQGEVHDPRAYALEGIAGHAGLFSTATDLAVYAQMMINQGRYGGASILSPGIVRTMTAAYTVPHGQRGLGWDKRSGYSSNRGEGMTAAAFGHGGFTGTSIWIDPDLELFVIFLSNRVHPDGQGSVNRLAGAIGTVAVDAVLAAEAK